MLTVTARAMSPPLEYTSKSNAELLLLLDGSSPEALTHALTALEWHLIYYARYGQDGNPDAAQVANITAKAFLLLKNNGNTTIKLAATNLLYALDRLTDTTDQIEYCLTEKDPQVQVNALRALQDIFSRRHQEMPPAAVSVLVQLLHPRGDTEDDMQILWQAAAIAGNMGPQAKPMIPLLQILLRISANGSSFSEQEAHTYAYEALQKIDKDANTSPAKPLSVPQSHR